jgi:hypothetical protein
VIGPRIDWTSSRRATRILLLLDRAHAEDEPRDALVFVDLQNAFGELDALLDFAVGKHRQEGAAQQLVIARITAQRGAVIRRRGRDVALSPGVAGGKIAARRGGAGKALARLLRPSAKHGWPSYGECGQCGHHRMPQEWRRDHGSSTPSGGRTALARPR